MSNLQSQVHFPSPPQKHTYSQNRPQQHSKILGIQIHMSVHEIKTPCADTAVMCLDLILKVPGVKIRSLFYFSRHGSLKQITISQLRSIYIHHTKTAL
jgi:hypothetical protein